MRTLGIDLAAGPKKTGDCVINWTVGDGAIVESASANVDDDAIVALAAMCQAIGIDSPFGWPLPLLDFLAAAHPRTPMVPRLSRFDGQELRLRRTDLFIRNTLGITPLAVGMDKIAAVAVRCLRLQSKLGVVDRSDDGRVFEVYPAAAIRSWEASLRAAITPPEQWNDPRAILRAMPLVCPGLAIPQPVFDRIDGNPDIFDAFIASLNARAATRGLTAKPMGDDRIAARSEGWIALPHADALAHLLA